MSRRTIRQTRQALDDRTYEGPTESQVHREITNKSQAKLHFAKHGL